MTTWESKQALYRIAQEALHNAGRHARATRVRVVLSQDESQVLLERCLELAPSFDAARHNYAVVLNREGKAAMALPQGSKAGLTLCVGSSTAAETSRTTS